MDEVEISTLMEKGLQAYQERRYTDAVVCYEQVLALAPETFAVYFHLAATLDTLGLAERAYQTMLKAHALRPENAAVCYNLGLLAKKMGRKKEAIAHLEKALALAQDDPALDDAQDFRKAVQALLRDLKPFKLF